MKLDTLASYERVSRKIGGLSRPMRVGRLAWRTEATSDPAHVDRMIVALGPLVGWCVRWSADSSLWFASSPSEPALTNSLPGDAELLGRGGCSLRIRQAGSTWRLTWVYRDPDRLPEQFASVEGLIEQRSYVIDPRFGLGSIVSTHDVLWGDAEGLARHIGYGPILMRFSGFEPLEREISNG